MDTGIQTKEEKTEIGTHLATAKAKMSNHLI